MLLVAAIAATVSFLHIEHIAATRGQTALAAVLLPVSVDGTVAAASLSMLWAARNQLRTPWLARFMLGLGVAATLGANAAYGASAGTGGVLVSIWPGCAFVGSVELAVMMARTARSTAGTAHSAAGIAAERAVVAALPSKAAAVRHAIGALGTQNAADITAWLAERGVDVGASYIRDVAARRRPPLRAVDDAGTGL